MKRGEEAQKDTRQDGERLLTVREAAALIGVSPRKIWRMIAIGEFRPFRFGRSVRIARAELLRSGRAKKK